MVKASSHCHSKRAHAESLESGVNTGRTNKGLAGELTSCSVLVHLLHTHSHTVSPLVPMPSRNLTERVYVPLTLLQDAVHPNRSPTHPREQTQPLHSLQVLYTDLTSTARIRCLQRPPEQQRACGRLTTAQI